MTIRLRARGFAFALSVLLTTITASWATDQTITLTLGTGSAFSLERPFNSVLIGDPNVVLYMTIVRSFLSRSTPERLTSFFLTRKAS